MTMVVIINGFFKVGDKYMNHSAIWEEVEDVDITIGSLIDQLPSYCKKIENKFYEEANDIFETPVLLRISNINFLFEKFDGVDDILLKFDAIGDITLDNLKDVVVIRNTQVVQFMDGDGETVSEIFAVPKIFYDSWKGGVRRTDFDFFNNSIDGCRKILEDCIGDIEDIKNFKFRYIRPFEFDQTLGWDTYEFISSDQLSMEYISQKNHSL